MNYSHKTQLKVIKMETELSLFFYTTCSRFLYDVHTNHTIWQKAVERRWKTMDDNIRWNLLFINSLFTFSFEWLNILSKVLFFSS